MKVYEYARKRNINSRDVVKKLHELGYKHIKNHLSLVPLKIIDKLDEINFEPKNSKYQPKTIIYISFECSPFNKGEIANRIQRKIKNNKRNKNIIILPKYNINIKLDKILEKNIFINGIKFKGNVYKTIYKNNNYYFIESESYIDKEVYYLAFFSKMSLELINFLDCKVDLINIHDWKLGLFPLMFRKFKAKYYDTIIEFTLYYVTYRGIYAKNILLDVFDIDKKYLPLAEYAGSINLLKAGIVSADKIDMDKKTLIEFKESYLKNFIYDNM